MYGIYMLAMDKTTVYLPGKLKKALARAARERGVSEAQIIRAAIAQATEGFDAPPPRLPLFRSSGPSIAEAIDEALAGFGTR